MCMFIQLLKCSFLCASKASMKNVSLVSFFHTSHFFLLLLALILYHYFLSHFPWYWYAATLVVSCIWTLRDAYFFSGFEQWGYLNILCKTKYHSRTSRPFDDSTALLDRAEAKKHTYQICSPGNKTCWYLDLWQWLLLHFFIFLGFVMVLPVCAFTAVSLHEQTSSFCIRSFKPWCHFLFSLYSNSFYLIRSNWLH